MSSKRGRTAAKNSGVEQNSFRQKKKKRKENNNNNNNCENEGWNIEL